MHSPIIIEDFLSVDECSWWINFHKEHYESLGEEFYGTHILDLYDTTVDFYKKDQQASSDPIKYMYARLSAHIGTLDKYAYPNYSQVVVWPEGSKQQRHLDLPFHVYTSIIYLNDNFEGGNTRVDDFEIIPKTGKLITFKGNDILHEVLTITKGNRWTLPTWYKNYSVV